MNTPLDPSFPFPRGCASFSAPMVIKHSFQKWAALLTALLLSVAASADTVILKSGEKIQGKILSENDKEVVVEEQVSAGITDTRSVPKADVAKVEKIALDEPAYQAIKNLKPGPNSLPAQSYEQVTRNLNSFINNFTNSTHAPAVKAQLKEWEDEKKRVDAGEVKLDGKWLGKDEAQKERYQINGQVIFNHMQQQIRQNDLTGAMNSFDQLERSFPGARTYPDAVDSAKKIVPTLKSSADRALQNFKFQQTEREKGLQLLSDAQKTETLAGIQRDQQRADAAVDAANKAGLKWPPMVPNEKALTDISNKAQEEQRRLAELPVAKMRESMKLVAKAQTELTEKKFEDAEATLRQANEAWSANEMVARLQTDASTLKSAAGDTSTTDAATASSGDAAAAEGSETSSSESGDEASGEDAAAEEETSFFKTPAGMVTLLIGAILVIAVFSAFRKISKKASEVIQ
jgi:tetratricopeptide (TPR) repeat protein